MLFSFAQKYFLNSVDALLDISSSSEGQLPLKCRVKRKVSETERCLNMMCYLFFLHWITVSLHMTIHFEQYQEKDATPETADTFFYYTVKPKHFVIRVRQVQ